MKRYLFVMCHLPHVGCAVQETLDQMLTAAAFDQAVGVLFVDDGVWQLKQGQQPAQLAGRDTSAVFNALSIYDIDQLWVERESLLERGLTQEDLLLPVQLVERNRVNSLMNQYQILIPG